jgi:hypothetical protein
MWAINLIDDEGAYMDAWQFSVRETTKSIN